MFSPRTAPLGAVCLWLIAGAFAPTANAQQIADSATPALRDVVRRLWNENPRGPGRGCRTASGAGARTCRRPACLQPHADLRRRECRRRSPHRRSQHRAGPERKTPRARRGGRRRRARHRSALRHRAPRCRRAVAQGVVRQPARGTPERTRPTAPRPHATLRRTRGTTPRRGRHQHVGARPGRAGAGRSADTAGVACRTGSRGTGDPCRGRCRCHRAAARPPGAPATRARQRSSRLPPTNGRKGSRHARNRNAPRPASPSRGVPACPIRR